MALTFPKSFRFQRSSEFLRVKTAGRAYSGRMMTIGVLKGCENSKAGFITSKRVGGAVERNRVRRRLRELVRHSRLDWAPGIQVVVIARRAAVGVPFEKLKAEWLTLARKAGVFAAPGPKSGGGTEVCDGGTPACDGGVHARDGGAHV